MNTITKLILSTILTAVLFSTACLKDNEPVILYPSEGSSLSKIKTEGVLVPAEGSLLGFSDLKVISFANDAGLDENGHFAVEAVASDNFQIILFNEKNSNDLIYMGIYDPVADTVIANTETTALAMLMLNPLMIYADYQHIKVYFEEVKSNHKFDQLVLLIRDQHLAEPQNLFDYETNPNIYQLAFELMKEAMQSLEEKRGLKDMGSVINAPVIEDAEGPDILFINPRFVWYGAAVYSDNQQLKNVAHINRVDKLVSFEWGWPPLASPEFKGTLYRLNDGAYKIHLAKGYDLSKIADKEDAVGVGTMLNTAQSIVYIVKIAIGTVPMPNVATLPGHLSISANHVLGFSNAYQENDVPAFVMAFCDLLTGNAENIGYWIWQEHRSNAATNFVRSIGGVISNVTFVFKVLGFVNEQVPFFYDLLYAAPKEVTYFITHEDGVITSREENNPPVVDFHVNPPAGIIGTNFTFDASETEDDLDDLAGLLFRWDFEGDGNWNIEWDDKYVVEHTYEVNKSYLVTLEVKDSGGLVGSKTKRVNVGGGAGSASRVKLFRDNLPWNSNAIVTMLESLNFTEGSGQNQYQIIPSNLMATVELIPGEDLVIISNDQNQGFYNNYAASQIRFNNFVYQGGALFWEACDMGWAQGSMSTAGVILPGNISAHLNFANYNYIVNPHLPLVYGLPDEMDHNYASHENFSNLPDGTIVYCVDNQNKPTLIEFNLGQGWVLISGQPLEHQYENIYGNPDMEKLLPRIVSYFTGQSFEKGLPLQIQRVSERPSHI